MDLAAWHCRLNVARHTGAVQNGSDDPSPQWWWDEDDHADDPEEPWGGSAAPYYSGRGLTHPLSRRARRALAVAAGVAGALVISAGAVFAYHPLMAFVQPKAASIAPAGPRSGSRAASVPPRGSGSASSLGAGSTPDRSASQPLDSAAVAGRVDPGLVDINSVIDYGQAEVAGTGMVLTPNGEVLTNNHVVEGASTINVTDVGNGQTYQATVVGYSVNSDVAVLQLSGASGMQTVTTAGAAPLVGDQVVGIGNAGGVGGTPSYAGGTVIATGQTVTATDELTGSQEQLTGMVETDADIQAGDSGGPLVNGSGQVLGMDTAGSQYIQIASQSQGVGFAIPIATATAVISEILRGSSSSSVHVGPTAFLGILVAGSGGSGFGPGSGSGVAIAAVISGLPAAEAGLGPGDTITSVGGYTVTTQPGLEQLMMTDFWPGEVVTVQYTDGAGQPQSVTLALASGPPF
jgi:S1-C subfamily serine protease